MGCVVCHIHVLTRISSISPSLPLPIFISQGAHLSRSQGPHPPTPVRTTRSGWVGGREGGDGGCVAKYIGPASSICLLTYLSFPHSLPQMRGPLCPPDASSSPGPPLGAGRRRAVAGEEFGGDTSRTQALQCPEEISGGRADGTWHLYVFFLFLFISYLFFFFMARVFDVGSTSP